MVRSPFSRIERIAVLSDPFRLYGQLIPAGFRVGGYLIIGVAESESRMH